MNALQPYHVTLKRLAIALIFTFIAVDLCPHPSLPPGLILTTVSKIQFANATDAGVSDSATARK